MKYDDTNGKARMEPQKGKKMKENNPYKKHAGTGWEEAKVDF